MGMKTKTFAIGFLLGVPWGILFVAWRQGAASNGGSTQNLTFHTEISNGMDMANFEQRVLRAIERSMR